ncbi:MAG: D-2-hydroxyacid dehydrogenase [Planctomycetes bacterium]|nr:D-2-hydroxyacid dehydrogenase [Planctomycetota bacterium]
MKLVIFPPIETDRLQKVREAAGEMMVVNAQDQTEALREIVDADAFYGRITPELLAAARQLRWVQAPTASLEHYLFDELIHHPCLLSNMRGLYSDVIADHVMGMVLCFARNLHLYVRQQMQAVWAPIGGDDDRVAVSFQVGQSHVTETDRRHLHLADCTMGVVGAGHIGSEVCRRAAAFGMSVLAVDPVCREVPGVVREVWTTRHLPELLERSDFVVITAPHTPETEKMFRREQFQQMKNSAYLINVGRGVIVDLADLTVALQEGEIAGAGLDVLETEPLPPDHPLWRMDNVIITPHVASASPRIAERHLRALCRNIRRFASGEEPLNLVDKSRWF